MIGEDTTDWPQPFRRFRSFEAEPFPMTAYRYDKRGPLDVVRGGFRGTPVYPNRLVSRTYGENTLVASASRKGAERSWSFHSQRYARPFARQRRGSIDSAYESVDGEGPWEDPLEVDNLYRIKTDTHNAVAVGDLSKEYGENYTRFSYLNTRSKDFEAKPISDELMSPSRIPQVGRQTQVIQSTHGAMDEIHVKSDLKAAAEVGQRRVGPIADVAAESVEYAGAEYLDLELAAFSMI